MALFGLKKNKQANIPPPMQTNSVSDLPFEAYKGKNPYIFISYAHADSEQVFPIIKEFHDLGYNVWYDEGIEPGIAWPEEIGRALERCSLFVVFISPRSVISDNVDNEIYVALTKKRPFIAIYLEPTKLTPGQELQFGKRQAINKYELSDQAFQRKYTYSFEATEVKTGKYRQMPVPGNSEDIANRQLSKTPAAQELSLPQTSPPATLYRPSAELNVFVPKGTAKITMNDGTQYTATANTLIAYLKKSGNYIRYPYRYLDDTASLPCSSDETIVFEDLSTISLSRSEDGSIILAKCTDYDDITYIKEISDTQADFWCITGNDQKVMTQIPVANVREIVFNYQSTPDYAIPMTLIERSTSKSLLVPRASVIAEIRISNLGGAPSFFFVDYVPLETSGNLPFKRIRTLTVDNITKEPKMFSPETEAVLTVVKKNGETVTDNLNSCYTLFSLTSNEIISPALSSIIKITFEYISA